MRLQVNSAVVALRGAAGDSRERRSCCKAGAHRCRQHHRRATRAASTPDTAGATPEFVADAHTASDEDAEQEGGGYEDDSDSEDDNDSCTFTGDCCPWGWCEGDRARHALLCRTSREHFGVASLHLYSRAQLWLRGLPDPWARDGNGDIVALEPQPVPPPDLLSADESTPEGRALLEEAERTWAEAAQEDAEAEQYLHVHADEGLQMTALVAQAEEAHASAERVQV
jgi:hypothetical protein